MTAKAKYMLIAFVLIGFVLMPLSALAGDKGCAKPYGEAGEYKGTSSKPIVDIVDNTPSLKEMQGKPARGLSYTFDILGNKVPTQTDNSGKRQ